MVGLIALFLAYVLSQFYRSFLAVLTPQLTTDLQTDKADLALASGMWFVAFGLMQFIVGVSLDRFGPRRTAGVIFGLAGVGGSLVFALAQTPVFIVIAMCLFGIACSPVLMAALFIFAKRMNPHQFAITASWLVAFGNLGNLLGTSPLAHAVDLFGWRQVMVGLGLVTFLISAIIYFFVKDPKPGTTTGVGFSGYLELLKIRSLWPILAMCVVCYAPAAGIRGLWTGPYLTDLHQANSLLIGQVTFWMAIAMITGSLIYGPLDNIFKTHKWVALTGNFVALIAITAFAISPNTDLMLATILLMVIGVCGASYGVMMAHGRDFVPKELTGRGVTLLNFCAMFGAGAMQFVSGFVVNQQPGPGSVEAYRLLFTSYAIPLAIALFVYSFSKDKPQPN